MACALFSLYVAAQILASRLGMLAILEAKLGGLLAMLGHCCSSWVSISKGSTYRSFLNPMGHTGYAKVRDANVMSCRSGAVIRWHVFGMFDLWCNISIPVRTVLLLLMVESLSGVWVVEQPGSSLLFDAERFVWLIGHLGTLSMRVLCLQYDML